MSFVQRVLIGDRPERGLGRSLRMRHADVEIRDLRRDDIGGEDLRWAEAYIGFRPPRGADLGVSGLRWVHSTGAGVDGFLEVTALPLGAKLTRTEGAFGRRIAEYCLTRALVEFQELDRLQRAQRARRWEVFTPREIAGTKVVILGTGRIGSDIANAFRALHAEVHGISASGKPNAAFHSVVPIQRAGEALRDAAFVIAALPLTVATRGLIDRSMLAAMSGAYLMNVGRGATIDEPALIAALQEGTVRAAALDVFPSEPLSSASPLWEQSNVLISPHISARTADEEIIDSFLHCLRSYAEGKVPELEVDQARGY